jgi:hypothetical protein
MAVKGWQLWRSCRVWRTSRLQEAHHIILCLLRKEHSELADEFEKLLNTQRGE